VPRPSSTKRTSRGIRLAKRWATSARSSDGLITSGVMRRIGSLAPFPACAATSSFIRRR